MNTIVSIIPSYCPGKTLLQVVDSLKESDITCIVVNDGSPEEYNEIFESLHKMAIVLTHDVNQGKGAALKSAMRYIKENYEDCIVVCVDGDGQHRPKDVVDCAKAALTDPKHLVLGCRHFEKEKVPFKSYYGNRITEAVFRLFTGIHISDTQTGLRAFHEDLIDTLLKVEGERYEYEMNQLLHCVKEKIPFKEVEIEAVYEGKNECSHFHPFRDSFLIYGQILKFGFSSIVSFLLDFSLFAMLSEFFSSLTAANVFARIASGLVNYEINKRSVFKDQNDSLNSFARYVLLAIVILIVNTCLLNLFVSGLHMPKLLCKVMIECLMFLFSFHVQKSYIFAKEAR